MRYRIVEIYDLEYVIQRREWWNPVWRHAVWFKQGTDLDEVTARLEKIKKRAAFKRRVVG